MSLDWGLLAQWSASIMTAGGFAGGFAYFLFKRLVDNKLRQELEGYKSGLAKQLEDHKQDLKFQLQNHQKSIDKDLHEFSIQFSRLDRDVSDLISKV
ncbi:MAG: hypothetical protein C4522_07990 [Desulfobacteraceae bacterium]|nr:MAG: hypothetical protein C4522_07990 [Desulfobacteraceae bacterium]